MASLLPALPLFALGLLLALLPPSWAWGRGMQFLDGEQWRGRRIVAQGDARRRRRWWKSASVWAEPLRGLIIGYAVQQGLDGLCGEELLPMQRRAILFLGHGLLALTVLRACLGRGERRETLAPLFLVGGILAGAFHPLAGLCAFALSVLVAYTAGSLVAALFVMAVTMSLLFGGIFSRPSSAWLVATVLPLIPVIFAWLRHHRLVLPVRT
jgi:hypothetical protein